MAKRFTDTDKWKREWFYELEPNAKLVWLYLLDQCDHAGIWPRNFRLLSEQVGIKINHTHFVKWFGSKIIRFQEDKYFIPSFFDFQYGGSKEGFKAKQSALTQLSHLGLINSDGSYNTTEHLDNTSEHLGNCLGQSMDCPSIGISIGIGNSKSIKGGLGENEKTESIDLIYKTHYPRKEGKSAGIKTLLPQLKTEQDLVDLETAVTRYAKHIQDSRTEPKFIKMFSTFATSWRDWLDAEAGKGLAVKNYQNESNTDHDAEVAAMWAAK